MTQPSVTWSTHSDIGRTRERNEDAASGDLRRDPVTGEARGSFIVCDGMGGHVGGQEASRWAVSVLQEQLAWVLTESWPAESEVSRRVGKALLHAHRAIAAHNEGALLSGRERPGTTAVLLLLAGARGCVAHVGDSRAYQITRDGVAQLPADHNVATRQVNQGESLEQAWANPAARSLTQALGPIPEEHLRPTVSALALEQDSLFLLCTDGLSDGTFVELHEGRLLRPLLVSSADLGEGCRALVAEANTVNGHDNITALLVRVTGLGTGARAPTTEPGIATTTQRVKEPARASWLERVGLRKST